MTEQGPYDSARRPTRVRNALRLSVVLAMVGATSAVTAAPAGAIDEPCWDNTPIDIDGGGPDVVVGLPSYDLPGKADAGAILVYSNVGAAGNPAPRTPQARTLLTADDFDGLSAQAGARFGASIAIWRDGGGLDVDNCADLLVGAPGQAVDGTAGAGQVYRLLGTASGLTEVVTTFDEASLLGDGSEQAGAGFGTSLAVDAASMIAIGVPGRDIGSATDAGRVVRLNYLLAGDDPEVTTVARGADGAGAAESGDRFGQVLDLYPTGDGPVLLVWVPLEDVGSKVDAGAVASYPLSGPLSMVTQNSANTGGTAEAGDKFGAALDTYATFIIDHPVLIVAVGVPGEDVGNLKNAGLVSFAAVDLFLPEDPVAPIRGMGLTISQNSRGVAGAAEAGDAFGSAVATGEFGSDSGVPHLAVGSPGENLGSVVDAGMVSMTKFDIQTAMPLAGAQPGAWTQNSIGVSGTAESGDRFGAVLTSAYLAPVEDDDDVSWGLLLVSVPGENLGSTSDAGMAYLGVAPGAGSVHLVPATPQSGAGRGMVSGQMPLG